MSEALRGELALVTGGAGFIGSHLVEGLLAAGAHVRVLDDLSTGRIANLHGVIDRIALMPGDVRDPDTCRAACRGVRFVFHEAAVCSVPRSMDDPATTLAINATGAANVFAAAREVGARVVYASSSSVYGDSERLPQREGEEGEPLSIYALSKRIDEEIAAGFARSFGMVLVGLRYFNVFGARQDPNGPYAAVVPRFLAAVRAGQRPLIYGDGEQTRDFVYVGDVVRANLLAATAALTGAPVMNIGGGSVTTINELAAAIAKAAGRPDVTPEHAPARAGDIRHSRADCSKAAEQLGFRAEVGLAEGLARIP